MAGSYAAPEVIEEAKKANAHIPLLQVLPGKTLVDRVPHSPFLADTGFRGFP